MPKLDLTLPDDALSPRRADASSPGSSGRRCCDGRALPTRRSSAHLLDAPDELPSEALRTRPTARPRAARHRRGHHTAGRPERAQAGRPCRGGDEAVLDATGWGEEATLRVWVMSSEVGEGCGRRPARSCISSSCARPRRPRGTRRRTPVGADRLGRLRGVRLNSSRATSSGATPTSPARGRPRGARARGRGRRPATSTALVAAGRSRSPSRSRRA